MNKKKSEEIIIIATPILNIIDMLERLILIFLTKIKVL